MFSSGRNKGFYFAREPGDSETAEFGTAKSPANCSLLVRVTYRVATNSWSFDSTVRDDPQLIIGAGEGDAVLCVEG